MMGESTTLLTSVLPKEEVRALAVPTNSLILRHWSVCHPGSTIPVTLGGKNGPEKNAGGTSTSYWLSLSSLFFVFSWRIIALQCCIAFYTVYNCISRQLHESAICVHTSPHSWTTLPSLQVVTERQMELPVLYSNFPLAIYIMGLPLWLSGKESAFNAGDQGSIPGLGRSPGEGNGKQLQYSCLENPMYGRT